MRRVTAGVVIWVRDACGWGATMMVFTFPLKNFLFYQHSFTTLNNLRTLQQTHNKRILDQHITQTLWLQ